MSQSEHINSILITSARNGRSDILQGLLDRGADVNAKDSGGNTALIWAAWYGCVDIVRLLLDNGADVNVKNNFGDTALALAEKGVVELLEKNKGTSQY
jgi:ankyrin repeat protein